MKIAINGFGRIGRIVFKILTSDSNVDIVAINDLCNAEELAYLLKYDTTFRYNKNDKIDFDDNKLIFNDRVVPVFNETDPLNLPWEMLNVSYVIECTGRFTKYEDAHKHIDAGATCVIVSAPCKGDVKTIVYGVNEKTLDGNEKIISAASCTTNCLAPVLKVIDDNFGIINGNMTTVHAYTNDQVVLDVAHKKGMFERRGRAAAMNMVPTSTGAASAIGKVLPKLDGKLMGMAVRVPVSDGSMIDLSLNLAKPVTKDEINNCLTLNKSEILAVTTDPIVSSDVIGRDSGSLVDLLLTSCDKNFTHIVCWYDNEFGYSSQLVRTLKYLDKIKK